MSIRQSALVRVLLLAGAFTATPALAAWNLDGARSELTFISIKAGDVAETHRFAELSGAVSDGGAVSVRVALDSVDTLIPIRDERMREMLFETADFPAATLTAQLPAGALDLPVGQTADHTLEGLLTLREVTQPITLQVTAARLGDDRVLVASRRAVVLNAAQFELVAGIEKLREVAGLPSISKAVPVSFVLEFGLATEQPPAP
jgi:polyisoprenoid-binding protein YceI